MLRVIDITGVSSKDYKTATDNALKNLSDKGHRVQRFSEKMRGINNENGRKEFRVDLKVSVFI